MDLTRIDGVDVATVSAVVCAVGTATARFPTIKHFTSWLGLRLGTKITGGKACTTGLKKSIQINRLERVS